MTKPAKHRRHKPTARLLADIEHFRSRVIADALNEATGAYWMRRAADLDAAKRKPGEYVGTESAEESEARAANLEAAVLACRQRAAITCYDHSDDDLDLIGLALWEATQ